MSQEFPTSPQQPEHLLFRLCAALVEDKTALRIVPSFVGDLESLEIMCAPDDGPRLIGKGGTIFQALKWVVAAAGAKVGRRINLDTVLAERTAKQHRFPPFKFNPDWPAGETTKLLADVVDDVFFFPASVSLLMSSSGDESRASWRVTLSNRTDLTDGAGEQLSNLFNAISTTNGCRSSVAIITA